MESLTRSQLVERARNLAPVLAERALACERMRRIPDETIADFKEAGLLRTFVSPEFGGYGLEMATVIEIAREVGRACGSSAWCLAISNLHSHMASQYPQQVQAKIFGKTPDVVICGVFMPGGRLFSVDGGYRMSGSWEFASTSDHSDYAILAGLEFENAEQAALADAVPRGLANCLLPRSEYEIEDNWHVSGMRGTGSKKLVVTDVFVPESHLIRGMMEASGPLEDGKVTGRLSAGLPGASVATLGLTGVAIGIALGALETFRTRLATKLRMTNLKGPDQQVGAQLRYSTAAAEVDAAELLVLRDLDEMTRTAKSGIAATYEERARYRRDASWAIQACTRAVARLQPAAGGHVIFEEEPLQRAIRDLQAFSSHVVADWDASAEAYARAMTGLPKVDPLV